MIGYIVTGIVILVIFLTIYYYCNKNLPAKTCNNCRFYEKDTDVCGLGMYMPACKHWEWNGERDEKET